MSEYLTVLRDRYQRLLRTSSRSTATQQLQGQPLDDPEVLRCLRTLRAGEDKPSFVPNVRLADGNLSEDPRDIGKVFHRFVFTLFRSEPTVSAQNIIEQVRIFCGNLPTCPDFVNSTITRPATREELFELLRAMKVGSAPGPDGLPAEFYVAFWDTLADPLVKIVNHFLESKEVPPSFRCGHVVLLPKGGSPSYPAAWRPITLLNVDYKLVASLFASRLRPVLPYIVSTAQTCSVPGRSIFSSLSLTRDTFTYAH